MPSDHLAKLYPSEVTQTVAEIYEFAYEARELLDRQIKSTMILMVQFRE